MLASYKDRRLSAPTLTAQKELYDIGTSGSEHTEGVIGEHLLTQVEAC